MSIRGAVQLGAAALFAAIRAANAADAGQGEKLFVECASCHSIERGV